MKTYPTARRIAPLGPVDRLGLVEAEVVVVGRERDRGLLGLVGLDDDAAGPIAAPRPARDLREQLEGPLAGAKIRQRQPGVGAQHADQGHAREVVALGHHLGADQQIDLASGDPAQHRLDLIAGGHVAIEPRDPRLGIALGERGRDLLGAQALARDLAAAAARRAHLGHPLAEAAVVAEQPIGVLVVFISSL